MRFRQGNGTGIFQVKVSGVPEFLVRCHAKDERRVDDHSSCGIVLIQRCCIDKRLKSRTRLPSGLGSTIKLVFKKIDAADKRLDVAGLWFHRNQGALHPGLPFLVTFPLLKIASPVFYCLLGSFLHKEI